MANKAVYAGSFDPFTIGHLDIVRKAAKLFDEVHIVIGVNTSKQRSFPAPAMLMAINNTLQAEGLHNVKAYGCYGLIVEYAKHNGIPYLVRGLRNSIDYDYEENAAEVNELLCPELETVYLRANNSAISSTMVKELQRLGADISDFLPNEIYDLVERT